MRTLYRAGADYSPADPFATAIVVDDGTVAWLGSEEAAAAQARQVDAVVDLGDALVTPAFVDAHAHVTETGLHLTGVDLAGVPSVTAILDLVAEAARTGGGGAVLGHGWDEALLAEGRPPTRAELDRAAPGTAVYLSRVDVHSAVVSTTLAERSGAVGADGWSDDGRVERDAHHLTRNATREGLDPAHRRDLQRRALQAAAAAGIACLHEMSAPHIAPLDDLIALLELTEDPSSGLPQVIAYRGELVDHPDAARALLAQVPQLAGLAGDLCVDGSFGSRTAALSEDYTDAPGRRGRLYLDVDQIRDHVAACTLAGTQAGFHVIGDAAVAAVVQGVRRAAEQVGLAAVRAARHRLEHVEAVDGDVIAELADLGLTASVQPAFEATWGGTDGMYAQRLGVQRALALNPYASLAAAGVPLALGSDTPVTPFSPWAAVRACTFHHVVEQRTSARAAFGAHTRGGWRAAGQDGAGVLTLGAPATFAVWQAAELVVQAPDDRIQAWSTDPRSGTPGLPDLSPDLPLPTCLMTVRAGHVLHDATGQSSAGGSL